MTAADRQIRLQPLTRAAFAEFGDVLAVKAKADQIINQGMCHRHHNLAKLTFTEGGQAGISVFDATPRALPYTLDMMERHPKGSQAFVPMHNTPFLVIVAADKGGQPGRPKAFLTALHTGINIHKNIWHGVLTPLSAPGLFAVIDRIGNDTNIEEHWFDEAYTVIA
jgi:ureidoglycolate lyase